MPSKGQKVAKRQNQMRNRKRRGPRRSSTQQFEVGPEVSKTNLDGDEGAAPAAAMATAAAAAPVSGTSAASSRRRRSKQQVEDQGSMVSRFLPGELRHIGIVTAVIIAILAVATVTLGGSI